MCGISNLGTIAKIKVTGPEIAENKFYHAVPEPFKDYG